MTVAIIQARMNSERLPGKVLLDLCGKKVIDHVYNRVNKAKLVDKVYIATGLDHANDPIVEHCIKHGYNYYVGSQNDLTKRYADLMSLVCTDKEDRIVRVTSDCPLVDPEIIDDMLSKFDGLKYMTNQKTLIDGFDVEIMTAWVLGKMSVLYGPDEHCTLNYKKSGQEEISYYDSPINRSDVHLSLDTQEDYNYIKHIYDNLYYKNPNFGYEDVVKFLGL